jgi:hypothetical protein
MRELLVNHPDYHRNPVKPLSYEAWTEMFETEGRFTGLWRLAQTDPRTGEVRREIWNKNVLTDQGAINIFQAAIANAVPAAVFNNILLTNNSGATTLTSAIAISTSGITSISVAATPAAIPAATSLLLGFGSGTSQTIVTGGSTTTQGSTSITTVSFSTDGSHSYGVGAAVVPIPQVTDNPNNAGLTSSATTPLSIYSGNLSAGAFTYTATTGAGNRSCVVTFIFKTAANGGSTPIGTYTDGWLTNVNTGATTNNYVAHEINYPMRCDNSNNITATITLKI